MSTWGGAKARKVFAALLRIGWTVKRRASSHVTTGPGTSERVA
jgi:predicted RNA binding protein YcfA (HicA-like mRNA interferase family)